MDLSDNNKQKWDRSKDFLIDDLTRLKWGNVKPETSGDRERISLISPNGDLSIVVEYDNNTTNKSDRFGIYFGVRKEEGRLGNDEIENLWIRYKLKIYPHSHCKKTDIFQENEVDSSADGKKWQFWIRLNGDEDLRDALVYIEALRDALIQLNLW